MLNEFSSPNSGRPVLLCGSGEDVRAIGQTIRESNIPVYIFSDFHNAIESATEYGQCVLIVERRYIVGAENSSLRMRLSAHASISILAIGAEDSYKEAADLIRTGVAGFVQASFPAELLEKIFDAVQDGELWVTRRLLRSMINHQAAAPASLLTRREQEIVRRMVEGFNNREIAEALYVTRDTVRWHLRSAYAKLGVHDRQAVAELLWVGSEHSSSQFAEERFPKEAAFRAHA